MYNASGMHEVNRCYQLSHNPTRFILGKSTPAFLSYPVQKFSTLEQLQYQIGVDLTEGK
jgi:hypothetical protein